jgi:hypothetical protein
MERVARNFVRLMLVVAVVGVTQLATQLTGVWQYHDYLRELVPWQFLASTYNTSNPLEYGSPIIKSNAFVFLEPSFLSQYTALGAIAGVVLRVPTWQVVVLLAGVFSAVSGTGVLLLAVAAALVVVRARHLIRPVHLVAAAVVLAALFASPVAGLLLDRVDETSQVGSSGYLRFVQPYREVSAGLEAEPLRYLAGAGAGQVERQLTSQRDGDIGQAVVYSIVPKLLFEYGLIAGGLFVLFVLVALLDRGPWRVVPACTVVMLFVLSGSLLTPHTVYLAWLLVALWGGQGDLHRWRRERSRGRSVIRAPLGAVTVR